MSSLGLVDLLGKVGHGFTKLDYRLGGLGSGHGTGNGGLGDSRKGPLKTRQGKFIAGDGYNGLNLIIPHGVSGKGLKDSTNQLVFPNRLINGLKLGGNSPSPRDELQGVLITLKSHAKQITNELDAGNGIHRGMCGPKSINSIMPSLSIVDNMKVILGDKSAHPQLTLWPHVHV
jgi:hypothetical protein